MSCTTDIAFITLGLSLAAALSFLILFYDGRRRSQKREDLLNPPGNFCQLLKYHPNPRYQPIRRSVDPSKSGILSKLPAEIRLQIYEYAIGQRLVHLVDSDGRVSRRICFQENNVDAWYHRCWLAHQSKLLRFFQPELADPSDQLLPLLLTNRHVYSEAIDTLYSSNTFHFLRPGTLLQFVNSVGSESTGSIRSIKLYSNPTSSGTDVDYAAFWSVIRSLPRLQELRLFIAPSVMTREVWKRHESKLLEPIRSFDKHLQVFDVFLAVFADWTDETYQNSCHLKQIKDMKHLSGPHPSRYS